MKKILAVHYLAIFFLIGSALTVLFPKQPVLFEILHPNIGEEIILQAYGLGGLSNKFVSVENGLPVFTEDMKGLSNAPKNYIDVRYPFPLDFIGHIIYNFDASKKQAASVIFCILYYLIVMNRKVKI